MKKRPTKIHLNRETILSLDSPLTLRAVVGRSIDEACTFDGCTTSVNESGHPGCSYAQCGSLMPATGCT
jgi:hypothetical protein